MMTKISIRSSNPRLAVKRDWRSLSSLGSRWAKWCLLLCSSGLRCSTTVGSASCSLAPVAGLTPVAQQFSVAGSVCSLYSLSSVF